MSDPRAMDIAGERRPIVHVTADFPDPFNAAKTPVIRSLIDLTRGGFGHRVISLNRAAMRPGDFWRIGASSLDSVPFDYGDAIRYRAPARGILHRTMLLRLGRELAGMLAPETPALLLGHKLTIEGIAVAEAARTLGRPYAISIQGNTDTRILRARPDLRRAFARIFHDAAMVFPFTPWALADVEHRLGRRDGPVQLLPCPTDLDQPLVPVVPGNGFVSAFHLRHHRNKNLAAMVSAHRLLQSPSRQTGAGEVGLTIIGGGDARDLAACRAIASGHPGVAFAGALDRSALAGRLNRARGFIMPSFRESFGLVFIEALFAGVPVIYPRGAAIDGYFAGYPFAIPVNPRDPGEIAAAMQQVLDQEAALKAAIRAWQSTDHAQQFMRPQIAHAFAAGLETALDRRQSR